MTTDQLRAKLAHLEKQRGQLASAIAQCDGAIGFCKGLVQEAEKAEAAPKAEPAVAVNRLSKNGDLASQMADACGGES